MARLQILQLPEGSGDDRPPFVLIVDEYQPMRYVRGIDEGEPEVVDEFTFTAEQIGARAVLVFAETVEIPANAISGQTEPLMHVADFTSDEVRQLTENRDELHAELGLAHGQLHSAALSAIRGKRANIRELIERVEQAETERNEARQWARHGYEIGQRHCSWSDHGVAPDWLTEGWPGSFDSCEHLKKAAEYDTALGRVLEVAADLEAAEAHGGAWDANQQAARYIRAAVGRSRDEEPRKS